MRSLTTRLALLAVALFVVLGLGASALQPVRAQEAKVVCDSDLVLSLYIAETYFGYAALLDKMMMDANAMKMVDTKTIDHGQFAPLFDAMMKKMDNAMMAPGTVLNEEQMKAVMGMMSMDDKKLMESMAMGGDMSMMTTLQPAKIPGEPEACTTLRAELNKFYTVVAYQGTMAMAK
jgi:hypothetical protein